MPSRVTKNSTPITCLLNIQLDYSFLHNIVCVCWPSLCKYNYRKLDFSSKMCVFIWYNPIHKRYKWLHKSSGRIYISRDVIFDESWYPFVVSTISKSPSSISKIGSFPQSKPPIINDHMQNYDLSYLCTNVSNVVTTPLDLIAALLIQNQGSNSAKQQGPTLPIPPTTSQDNLAELILQLLLQHLLLATVVPRLALLNWQLRLHHHKKLWNVPKLERCFQKHMLMERFDMTPSSKHFLLSISLIVKLSKT